MDIGFKQFDTAPHYGCGLGEINLGIWIPVKIYSYV
jgi:aryl-alcohol dehydrogenase-like predicted oxidoreductase